MAQTPGVLLTGGDFQALAVLRSMGRRGIPCLVADHEHSICRYSRYARGCHKAPAPSDERAYVEFLSSLAASRNLEGWVLMPNSDAHVRVISRHRDALARIYRVPTPGWDVIEKVYDKKRSSQLARQYGIPYPETRWGRSLDEVLADRPAFPLVVKPSIRDNFYPKTRIKAFRVDDESQLRQVWDRVTAVVPAEEVLVQEFMAGGPRNLYSFCPFFKNGRSVAAVTARRSRQHPMDFGHASTFAELVELPELREIAENLLSLIRYYGIAEVEFMRDPRDGKFKLIEVNPRIWGWHGLAIAAGLDLPYLVYLDMLGRPLPELRGAAELKWIRLVTDIPTVASELARGRMTWKDYRASMRGPKAFAVLSARDPLPFAAELAMVPYLWLRRGF